MEKIKILISSVGSLVGQNILDVLEYSNFNRRHLTTIIGTNSLDSSPNNYRCDKCYLMPNTATDSFKELLLKILIAEKPDLILSGRDEDTETITEIVNESKLGVKSPYGNIKTLTIALDKWETWTFCKSNDLPFAETFKREEIESSTALDEFIKKNGFPLIAKPSRGFASKGVYFIENTKDAKLILEEKDYILQEYLGEGNKLKGYFNLMKGPVPLFAHAPNIYHYSCHIIIAPNGKLSPIFISKNDHNAGMTVGFKKIDNKVLENLTEKFALAIVKEGGFGPLTVQFKQDKNNNWKAQEINFRTNGNTFPRFLLGQDDIGLIINGILPEFKFPLFEMQGNPYDYIIGKSLRSDLILKNNISKLNNELAWERTPN